MIKKYWLKLLSVGLTDDTSFAESKKIKLVNEISFLILIANIFTSIRWFVLEQSHLVLLNISGILSMVIVILVNRKHHYRIAQLIFFSYIPVHLFATSIFLPIGMEQFLFPVMIIAGFLIDKRRELMTYLFILGFLYILLEGEFITFYISNLDQNLLKMFHIISSVLALSMCFVAINLFVKQYELNRHEVLIVNDMLEESVRIAKEKAEYAELLLKEMNHRVKNNLQLITSLLNIHAKKTINITAKKALLDAKNRVHSIALIHEKLYLDIDIDTVDIADYLDDLTQNMKASIPTEKKDSLAISSQCDHFRLNLADAVSVGLILNEMITNAVQHSLQEVEEKEIIVQVKKLSEEQLELSLVDNGSGLENILDEDKRGFGIELIETLTASFNGKLFVNKALNKLVVKLNIHNNSRHENE